MRIFMHAVLLTLCLNYKCGITGYRYMVGTHLLLLLWYLHLLSSNLLVESSNSNMNNNSWMQPIYFPIIFFKVAFHIFRKVSTLLSPSYFSDMKVLWNCNKTNGRSFECISSGHFFQFLISIYFFFPWKCEGVLSINKDFRDS